MVAWFWSAESIHCRRIHADDNHDPTVVECGGRSRGYEVSMSRMEPSSAAIPDGVSAPHNEGTRQQISILIGNDGRRLSSTATAKEVVVRIFSVKPAVAGHSGKIESSRFPATTDFIQAALEVLIAHGSQAVENAYAAVQVTHRRWRDGCPGMRPKSSAAWKALVHDAEVITRLAISYAAAYRHLSTLEPLRRSLATLPDWLDSALEDLRLGHDAKDSARELVKAISAG